MRTYIAKRLLWAIPTFLGAVTIIFLLMNVLPGDIVFVILGEESGEIDPEQYAILREELGLNRPVWQQYFTWIGGLFQLDLGTSQWTGQSVWFEISARLPYSISIIVFAIIISVCTSIPVGVISAVNQDGWLDYALRSIVIAGISLPNFWFGLLLLLFLVSVFTWSPPPEYATLWTKPLVAIQQLFLPAIVLGFRSSAASARMMRSSMLEVLREDYVRTARAMGLREGTVIYVQALRNAILPVVTMIGMEITFMFAGTVIIETVFNIPGIGLLLIDAINRRDIMVVQGVVVTIVTIVLVVNLVVDLLYVWINPRIRYS